MPPAAGFHAQLASIMEVLANTAVAEICELVDSGYSVLQLEINRSRRENEQLRRKLRLMELRAARATTLRTAVTASGSARAQLGPEPRRTPAAERLPSTSSNQQMTRSRDPEPPSACGAETTQGLMTAGEIVAVIKVEDDDDDDQSWSQSEPQKIFCRANEVQTKKTEASSVPVKQEVVDNSSASWTCGEVSSTSTQHTLNTNPRSNSGGYDCIIFEPRFHHGSHATQNPLGLDTGCSTVSDSGSSSFSFTISEASVLNNQQRAPQPTDEQQRPAMKEAAGQQGGLMWMDGGVREDAGTKPFVCTFCGKNLACLKNLKTHIRVHTGEKPFVCKLCDKRFSDSSNLKRHQSVHTGEKRYSCIHCGKRFAQSGSLKVHMTVHTDCKQFRCSYCGKTFISGSHLRRHVLTHAGEK